MKTIDEFREFYRTRLHGSLNRLESERRRLAWRLAFAWILILSGPALYLVSHGFDSEKYYAIYGAFAFLGASVLFFGGLIYREIIKRRIRKYAQTFKEAVVKRIVKFIGDDLEYDPVGFVPLEDFMLSRIFERKPTKYYGDDYVEGVYGETKLKFSELHAYQLIKREGKKTKRIDIFDGLFFRFDFGQDFSGRTYVLPDIQERFIGGLAQKIQSRKKSYGSLIHMQNEEFEKNFVVYCTDENEAKLLLTNRIMDNIVRFKKKSKKKIHLSFAHSYMFLAISFKKELFEPSIFGRLLPFYKIRTYFEDLQLALGTVEDLPLSKAFTSN